MWTEGFTDGGAPGSGELQAAGGIESEGKAAAWAVAVGAQVGEGEVELGGHRN